MENIYNREGGQSQLLKDGLLKDRLLKDRLLKDRELEVHIQINSCLGQPVKHVLKNPACKVTVNKPGLPVLNSCIVEIYNLPSETAVQLASLGFSPDDAGLAVVKIYSMENGVPSLVFSGDIHPGGTFSDLSDPHSPVFRVSAVGGHAALVTPIPPTSVQGRADLQSIIQQLALKAGFSFSPVASLADKELYNPYLTGSVLKQLADAARFAGVELILDDERIEILGDTAFQQPVVMDEYSGLLCEPSFSQTGISFKCIYSPLLRPGGLIRMELGAPKARGVWVITGIKHQLSLLPGGVLAFGGKYILC